MARVTSSQRRSHLSLASERTSQKMFLELSESVPVAARKYQPEKYSWTYPSRSLLEGARPQPEKYSWSYPVFAPLPNRSVETEKCSWT
jgi:hypothetical protein